MFDSLVIHCQWIELTLVLSVFHPLLSREQSLFVLRISPGKLNGFENIVVQDYRRSCLFYFGSHCWVKVYYPDFTLFHRSFQSQGS